MMKVWRLLILMSVSLLGFSPLTVRAAALEVTPVHLHITQENPTDAFTLLNKGDKPVLIQASVVNWSQANEKDNYQKTNDIIVNPPIFTLQAQDSQVVRVGLRNGWTAIDQEGSYRLYLQEVNKQLKNVSGVRTLLRLSMPIFIEPPKQTANLRWRAEKSPQGKLILHAVNQGNTHFQISRIEINSTTSQKPLLDQIVFAYILPHQSKTWTFNVSSLATGSPLKITADTNAGKVTADAKITV